MEIETKIETIDRNVTNILHLLTGTSLHENSGLISQFEQEKKERIAISLRLSKLESLKDKFSYLILGMSVPAGYGLFNFIKLLFLK